MPVSVIYKGLRSPDALSSEATDTRWRNNSSLVVAYHHDCKLLIMKPVYLQRLYYCFVDYCKSLELFRLHYNSRRRLSPKASGWARCANIGTVITRATLEMRPSIRGHHSDVGQNKANRKLERPPGEWVDASGSQRLLHCAENLMLS